MNIDIADLKKIAVHFAGNKSRQEKLVLSQEEFEAADEDAKIISTGFLSRFKNPGEAFCFYHNESLSFNEVYNYCSEVFEDNGRFLSSSQSITRQLYEASVHQKVKGGEVYVVYFENLPVEGKIYQAMGIFKTEDKLFFLDVEQKKQQLKLSLREGVEVGKMDKGCLVINRNKDQGFEVLVFDNKNRGEEAQYWKDDFLGIKPLNNDYNNTQHFLQLTKQFITNELDTLEVPGTEKLNLLNRSIDYFKSNDAFNIEEFQKEVFVEDDKIESFREFGSRYTMVNDFDIAAGFDISSNAVKKQSRIFKSVLKLDKNFHIYIHGRTDLIEKGVENDGRKYYKIFYQDEA